MHYHHDHPISPSSKNPKLRIITKRIPLLVTPVLDGLFFFKGDPLRELGSTLSDRD